MRDFLKLFLLAVLLCGFHFAHASLVEGAMLQKINQNGCKMQCKRLSSTKNNPNFLPSSTDACSHFKQLRDDPTNAMKACVHGYEIGVQIGCSHRCTSEKQHWIVYHPSVKKSREIACKPWTPKMQQYCTYGFHLSLLEIFDYSVHIPAQNSENHSTSVRRSSLQSEDYVSTRDFADEYRESLRKIQNSTDNGIITFPMLLPENVIKYVFMQSNDDPQQVAKDFCQTTYNLRDSKIQQECVLRLQNTISRHVLYGFWHYRSADDIGFIAAELPVKVNNEIDVDILILRNETIRENACSFCREMKVDLEPRPSSGYGSCCNSLHDNILLKLRY